MLTGARSDVGQTSWFFEDGSSALNPSYPPGDRSKCQQLSWQFAYKDGINLYPKDCSGKLVKFVCEYAGSLEQYFLNQIFYLTNYQFQPKNQSVLS